MSEYRPRGPRKDIYYDNYFQKASTNDEWIADAETVEWARSRRLKCKHCGLQHKLSENLVFLSQFGETGVAGDSRVAHVKKTTWFKTGVIWSGCPNCSQSVVSVYGDYFMRTLLTISITTSIIAMALNIGVIIF